MVNHAEYHISKPFLGQALNPIPAYRHDSMRRFYVIHELPDYLDSRSLWGVRQIVERNAAIVYVFFFCPVGLLMLAGWLRMLRSPAQSMVALSAVAALFHRLPGSGLRMGTTPRRPRARSSWLGWLGCGLRTMKWTATKVRGHAKNWTWRFRGPW